MGTSSMNCLLEIEITRAEGLRAMDFRLLGWVGLYLYCDLTEPALFQFNLLKQTEERFVILHLGLICLGLAVYL